MNGEYPLSPTPGSKNMGKLFPNQYRDYPGGAEMFEVYSPPITTLYSQVRKERMNDKKEETTT